MNELDTFERYLVDEFYDDYRDGLISRRALIRRVAFMVGGMAAAIPVLTAAGCTTDELPEPTDPLPPPALATSDAAPADTPAAAEARSPYSVPEDDPAVRAGTITFDSQGDAISAYLAEPSAAGRYPAVLVCHENRGLNPHIEDVARRLAKAGYVALAIDLLSREGGTSAHDRDEVPGLLTNAGAERHVADFAAGYDHLQGMESVDGERIGMIGFCFGGGITWRAATSLAGLKAAVPFYGPAPDVDQVPNIQAAMLGVYAELDDRVNAGKADLEQALQDAGIRHQMNVYPGVSHAFHNDTGERYVQDQASQAWEDALAWFESHL